MDYKNITIEPTHKVFSILGGLDFFQVILHKINIEQRLKDLLPQEDGPKSIPSLRKFITLIMAFISGGDCLDDLDILRHDPLFHSLSDGGCASTTMGQFLRSFKNRSVELLSRLLLDVALTLRRSLFPKDKNFVFAIDSTPHVQCGKKIEGVAYNYDGLWCLDSLNVFDQYGFSYGFDLRPGNTYSAQGAELMIYQILKSLPHGSKKFVRADSAYSSLSVYNTLLNAQAYFTIALKENVYAALLEKYGHNIKWKYTKINFFDPKKFYSDKSQLGNCLYPLKGLAGSRRYLRVLFARVPKKCEANLEFGYYAIVTNIGVHELNDEKLIHFHRQRSNAENFIKDLKYGLDFLHFPCLKLMANKAYGFAGVIAYNLMRFASFLIDKKKGCFIKKVRKKILHLPCQVIKHARYITLKMNIFHKEVIEEKINNIQWMFKSVFLIHFEKT